MLEKLNQLNQINIKRTNHIDFSKYGRVLTGYDFTNLIDYVALNTEIPERQNIYVGSDTEMELLPIHKQLEESFFGSFPLQIGYCNGNNSQLNALEYHKSSEIDIAVTPLVLLLASTTQIKDNRISSSSVEAFYLEQGMAVELYATTLHFSPCKIQSSGFRSIIILPKGTNCPLTYTPEQHNPEDALLWMTNKWLIAHKDSIPAKKGAYVGILGENLQIKFE